MCDNDHHHHHHTEHDASSGTLPPPPIPVLAVCGKGGVGKTAFSALLSREILDAGIQPLLLVDADPAGGLVSALGERSLTTLAAVRSRVIAAARESNDESKLALAEKIDYLLLEALTERDDHAILPMGLSKEKGCYCPVNKLLRSSIEYLMDAFAAILIDAEAGMEQIHRQVTQRTSRIIVVIDGSVRSLETLRMIADTTPASDLWVVANRVDDFSDSLLPATVSLLGTIPDDLELRAFDRRGQSLWELPEENPARICVRQMAQQLLPAPAKWTRTKPADAFSGVAATR